MTSSSVLEVRKSIFSTLNGSITYDSATVPVYAPYVVQGSSFPYIILDSFNASEDGTKGTLGERIQMEINIWDESRNQEGVQTVTNSIYNLLHRQESSITVSGFDIWDIQQTASSYVTTEDQATNRQYQLALLNYKINVQPSS